MKIIYKFIHNKSGVVAIEFALILPVLLGFLLGVVVIYDALRVSSDAAYANDTMADLTARRSIVNATSIGQTFAIGKGLLPGGGDRFTWRSRLSSIEFVDNKYAVMWSKTAGDIEKLTKEMVEAMSLPSLSEFDTLIIAETEVDFVPMFNISDIGQQTYHYLSYRRPR
ncbi:MAG: pilus assembly protein, partial [OCS116 cluster bacterium]|nr:pilus assembly protein [OCS116 cluster bacterium]